MTTAGKVSDTFKPSPSTRRAWIEIVARDLDQRKRFVALHPEGVDRNGKLVMSYPEAWASPSTRRAWIEILSSSFIMANIFFGRPPPGGRG